MSEKDISSDANCSIPASGLPSGERASAVISPGEQEREDPALKALQQWEIDTEKPASAPEGNAFIDGFYAATRELRGQLEQAQKDYALELKRAESWKDEASREANRADAVETALREAREALAKIGNRVGQPNTYYACAEYQAKELEKTLQEVSKLVVAALSVPTEAPRGKFPIDRPCSACSAGDSEMKYHDHEVPFRPATEATKLISREEFISNWPEDSAQKNPYKVTFPEATKDVK